MKWNFTDTIDAVLISLGISLSISDIHQILSIILIVFNLVWLTLKFIIKFFKYYSNDGKLDHEEIDDLLNDVDKINKEGDNNGED